MIKVETVKPHENSFGAQPEKAVGDRYSLPDRAAEGLIADGLVKRPERKKAGEGAA
ncbi:MAG: hypothetical protein ACJ8DZ_06345 [Allosphingosinicella sp.]